MLINECNHPLIQHKLSYLRQHKEFVHFRDYEALIKELGILLGYEASWMLEATPFNTEKKASRYLPSNPEIKWRDGTHIANRPVIVPVVRSGLVMAHAMREIIPTAYMGHIGLYHDEQDGTPKEFMVTMPTKMLGRKFFLVDLFIDRGLTAEKAIDILLDLAVPAKEIVFISLIMSPAGVAQLEARKDFQDITFYCARVDGSDDLASPDNWLQDYQQTNERLFRTRNHDRQGAG